MFEICVKSGFSSAHRLREYKGKCEELHGQNWKVDVYILTKGLDKIGMVVDFHDVKAALNKVLKNLDHKYLNDLAYFKRNNPTSENIAKFIFNSLKKVNPKLGVSKVTVWESDTSSASYIK